MQGKYRGPHQSWAIEFENLQKTIYNFGMTLLHALPNQAESKLLTASKEIMFMHADIRSPMRSIASQTRFSVILLQMWKHASEQVINIGSKWDNIFASMLLPCCSFSQQLPGLAICYRSFLGALCAYLRVFVARAMPHTLRPGS